MFSREKHVGIKDIYSVETESDPLILLRNAHVCKHIEGKAYILAYGKRIKKSASLEKHTHGTADLLFFAEIELVEQLAIVKYISTVDFMQTNNRFEQHSFSGS